VANNGREALDIIHKVNIDLILMDVDMPEMDGHEATRRIRQLECSTGAHIPIVALTAHAMKGDRERCLTAGMDSYLTKPLASTELYQTIEDLLRQKTVEVHLATNEQLDRSLTHL